MKALFVTSEIADFALLIELARALPDGGARLLFCCGTFLGESYPAMLAPLSLRKIDGRNSSSVFDK